ncbi:MAG: protein adenylyltransferase SelO family protein, partial [Fluviibacter sp.]
MGQALGLKECGLKLSYTSLPAVFHSSLTPQPVRAPVLKVLNTALAQSLGLDPAALAAPDNVSLLAGNAFLPNQAAIAQAYAGHQFGGFAILGDGRALLLGELDTTEGQVVDIQLKGSGPTPYARRGDGRAALGPMLREYLISEAMHGLRIPTTRSLAVVATGEPVFREGVQPGAVLTRVAASHIRVGTFEFAATQGSVELRALADYAIDRHYPQARSVSNPYLAFLKAVIDRQAALIARWM